MKSIKSYKHIIKTCEIPKFSLSCFDNKRYILEDGITTLTYEHFRLPQRDNIQQKGNNRSQAP